jgi:hypothetical protein
LSSQHSALWSHFCWRISIQTIATSKFSKSSADLPPSVRKDTLPHHSFCFQGGEDGQGWWAYHGQVWVDQVGVSYGSRQPSIRLQVVPKVCYLQRWITRRLDQVGDGLSRDWEPDAHFNDFILIQLLMVFLRKIQKVAVEVIQPFYKLLYGHVKLHVYTLLTASYNTFSGIWHA